MNRVDGGYLTFEEREAYRDGIGRVMDSRRLYGLQGVMRDVRRQAKHTRDVQNATLLGANGYSARAAAAYCAGMVDAALAIVQRVR